MRKKYRSKEFINSLIINSMELTLLYKKHKRLLLIPGALEQCIDAIKIYRHLKELRTLGLINRFYNSRGYINGCIEEHSYIYRYIDITPKRLRKAINKFKRVVELYEDKR